MAKKRSYYKKARKTYRKWSKPKTRKSSNIEYYGKLAIAAAVGSTLAKMGQNMLTEEQKEQYFLT